MNTLDASIFDNNSNYGSDTFINELRTKTTNILRKEFPTSYQKQQIKQDVNGLVIACPYCGDSTTRLSMKRGHLMMKGKWSGFYKCFNCGRFTPIHKFMHDFNEDLSLSGVKYVQEHKQEIGTYNSSSNEMLADIFGKSVAMQYAFPRDKFKQILNLMEIENNYYCKGAYDYLVGRGQFRFDKFMYDIKTNSIVILNLVDNCVIGFQLRRLDPKIDKSKRFLTFNLERIYHKLLKREDIEIPQELNTMSSIYDVYNINLYKPIIVTEGPMDAFLLPNAIAMTGANKKLSVELPLYYMFDSDKTGNKRAIERMREHKKVFLWGKLKADLHLPKREKWDTNDVINYVKKTYGNDMKIDWYKYFSDNVLDMIYLDDLNFRT